MMRCGKERGCGGGVELQRSIEDVEKWGSDTEWECVLGWGWHRMGL